MLARNLSSIKKVLSPIELEVFLSSMEKLASVPGQAQSIESKQIRADIKELRKGLGTLAFRKKKPN
jgi:hypothetical protein